MAFSAYVEMSHGGKSQKFDFASFQAGKEYSYKNLDTQKVDYFSKNYGGIAVKDAVMRRDGNN